MLNNGGFTQPCSSRNFLSTICGGAASFSTSFVNKPHLFLVPKPSPSFSAHCKTASLSSHSRQFRPTHIGFRAVRGERRGGLRVFSERKGEGSTGEVDVEDFEDDEEDFDDFDDFDEDEDEEDDEEVGVILPIEKMKKWLVKKPTGFGEGKAYDTSVEEKLLEELEKTRQAQAINIRNLKLNPVNPNSKKEDKKKKETGAITSGICVRVSNLPKKRNIHRDLELAYKGFTGIVNITPVVSGTKKTREPVCKGYGFIDFKSEKDASRFIEMFSKQTIVFGKVQKQVKYERVNSRPSNVSREKSSNAPGNRLLVLETTQDVEKTSDESNKPAMEDIKDDDLIVAEMEDNEDDELVIAEMEDIEDDDRIVAEFEDNEDDELVIVEMEDIEDDDRIVAEFEDNEDDELVIAEMEDTEDDEFLKAETGNARDDHIEPTVKSPADSSSSKKPLKLKTTRERLIANGRGEKAPNVDNSDSEETSRERIKLLEQRLLARLKGEKVPKLEIQGSAKWLKIKEEMGQSNVSKKQEKPKPKEKKQNAKANGGKARKLAAPVSAKRLRVREKAVLTEVFTKYGPKGGLASREGK